MVLKKCVYGNFMGKGNRWLFFFRPLLFRGCFFFDTNFFFFAKKKRKKKIKKKKKKKNKKKKKIPIPFFFLAKKCIYGIFFQKKSAFMVNKNDSRRKPVG